MLLLNASLAVRQTHDADAKLLIELASRLRERGNRLEAVVWNWLRPWHDSRARNGLQHSNAKRAMLLANDQSVRFVDGKTVRSRSKPLSAAGAEGRPSTSQAWVG